MSTKTPRFDGRTYDHKRDHTRLRTALEAVHDCLRDGQRWTVYELRDGVRLRTGKNHEAITARIRDLRKLKFGGHDIRKTHTGHGVYAYWMPNPNGDNEQ